MAHNVPKLRLMRRSIFLVSTILGAGLSAPAFSQGVSVPPERMTVDQNNVDLSQRNLFFEVPELQIGGSGSGLTYSRIWVGDGWRNNFNLLVRTLSATALTLTVGTKTLKFDLIGGIYVADGGGGETLTATASAYTFTDRDGTIIVFDRSYNNRWYKQNVNALGTSMTLPSGEVITLTYKNFTVPPNSAYTRLQSVNSSTGFQVKFSYAAANSDVMTSAKVINNTVDYCNPSADSCSFTQSWPYMNYTTSTTPDGLTTTETATDILGRVTRYTIKAVGIDALARLYGIKRPSSSVDTSSFVYTNKGKLSSATVEGVTWLYTGGTVGNVTTTTRTDPLSQTQVTVFNATTGTLTSFKDELNRTTANTYDASNRLDRTTAPEGNYVSYGYDGRGNTTTITSVSKTPGTPANIVVSAAFPVSCANARTCNNPTSTTDAKGNVSDYTYDSTHGGVLTVTLPAPVGGGVRPQTRYGYTPLQAYYKNSGGSIVASGIPVYKLTSVSSCMTTASCTGGADETKTITSYGPQTAGVANSLLPVSSTSGSGDGALAATTAATYDMIGNKLTVDGPLSGAADTTRYRYDAGRQLVGVVGPDPDAGGVRPDVAQRTTYNVDGQVALRELGTVTDQSDPAWAAFSSQQQVATTYDSNSRVVKSETKSGGTTYTLTQTSYDSLGRIDCIAQRMDPAQWAGQTVACTPQTTGPSGPDRVTKTLYTAASEVQTVQTAYGTTDQANEATNTYTSNGKLATLIDGEGNKTTYEYDGFDRVAKARFPDMTQGSGTSSTTDYVQPTYDANSNVTQLRLRDGQLIGFTFDNLNRKTFKDLPGSEPDVSYTYDLLGRMTQANQTGNTLGFTYDALSRKLAESGPLGTITSQYDIAGRRTSITWPDSAVTTYAYDVTGAMSGIYEGAGTSVWMNEYVYDNLGRRSALNRRYGANTSYSYDSVSRLSSLSHDLPGTSGDVTINGFAYNPGFQITSLTRNNDAYAWGGHYNVNRNYGINGLNQATTAGATSLGYDGRGNLTSSGANSYTYSSENLLKTGPGGVALTYDPLGRLYEVTNGSTTTRFQYDGGQVAAEYDGSNARLRRYVPGSGTDEPAFWYEGSGIGPASWYHTDERGSVIALSNQTSVVGINSYDEYGIPAATNLGRFQYTGQAWLPELGMYYYKARIYSPTLGRFMQTDPIGYDAGMNLYNYVDSDPVNGRDPTGLCTGTRICPDSNRNSSGGSTVTVYEGGYYKRKGSGSDPSDNHQQGDDIFVRSLYVWVRDAIIPSAVAAVPQPTAAPEPQVSEHELKCQRVAFANSVIDFADALDKGGNTVLQVAGASALLAIASSETVFGGVGFGSFALFSGSGGLTVKGSAQLLSSFGHTVGSLATNNDQAFQNNFMNGILGSASSGAGGVAGGIAEGAMQDAAKQPVPDHYTC